MKKCLLALATLLFNSSLFAASGLCENLSGTWSGTYCDPTQLFNAGHFPIAFQLKYTEGKVYGYSLPANDSAAGHFGEKKGEYLFFAECKHNVLTKVYFVKNANNVCGAPSNQSLHLTDHTLISGLILPYENAMTGANLKADLTKQTQPSTMDSTLLAQVKTIANGTITTCH